MPADTASTARSPARAEAPRAELGGPPSPSLPGLERRVGPHPLMKLALGIILVLVLMGIGIGVGVLLSGSSGELPGLPGDAPKDQPAN